MCLFGRLKYLLRAKINHNHKFSSFLHPVITFISTFLSRCDCFESRWEKKIRIINLNQVDILEFLMPNGRAIERH